MQNGIYIIKCLVDEKVYVGQSVQVNIRVKKHEYELRRNNHRNWHMQSAWNLYGEENFTFNVVLICEKSELDYYEKMLIYKLKSTCPEYGYNHESGGNKFKTVSDISKQKMSVAHMGQTSGRLGKKATPEQLERNRQAQLGKKLSPETRLKISLGNKGKGRRPGFTVSDELKEHLRKINTGKKMSEESRRKMSLSRIGIRFSESHRKSMSEVHKGKTASDETKLKISYSSLNCPKRKGTSSKYIGVSWNKRDKRWVCKTSINGKELIIGRFKIEDDAARAYNKKVQELHGENVHINIVE